MEERAWQVGPLRATPGGAGRMSSRPTYARNKSDAKCRLKYLPHKNPAELSTDAHLYGQLRFDEVAKSPDPGYFLGNLI